MELNKIYNCDCLDLMARMPDNFIDLVVTSPPYSDIRDYDNYKAGSLDINEIAHELFRVIKPGGVVVWVVGDKYKNWASNMESFYHATTITEAGFGLFDTMIYQKDSGIPNPVRYVNIFEFMFVFSKGRPKTINLLKQPSKFAGMIYGGGRRNKDGSFKPRPRKPVNEFSSRPNIWRYPTGNNKTTKDKIAFRHPAIFPEKLASDHIQSWSNPGDLVYDPFMGSGTTAKCCIIHNRKWIGSEISKEYCQVANDRLKQYLNKLL